MDAETRSVEFDGRAVTLDADGHLVDPEDWNEALAEAMAHSDGVELDALRWWLIRFVRDHHRRYGTPPLMRIVVRSMREQTACRDASSRTLYRLFPDGPIREACRYGGLPRPDSCI
ncbi:MAG: TusE/DsrC/DsvC family sulfur relay protein [Wenzhouxiangellaceae bacterium]|nr:TusE/DsrC/DsvC family sulfur relay protein [Wenzhouxiangellaceae bacterium]